MKKKIFTDCIIPLTTFIVIAIIVYMFAVKVWNSALLGMIVVFLIFIIIVIGTYLYFKK